MMRTDPGGVLSEAEASSGAAVESWIVWLIVAAVLGVAELVTITFAFGIIAAAAVVAAGVGAFHPDLAIQVAALVVAAGGGSRLPPSPRHPAHQAAAGAAHGNRRAGRPFGDRPGRGERAQRTSPHR